MINRKTCTSCNGTGRILQPIYHNDYQMELCWSCAGRGWEEVETIIKPTNVNKLRLIKGGK